MFGTCYTLYRLQSQLEKQQQTLVPLPLPQSSQITVPVHTTTKTLVGYTTTIHLLGMDCSVSLKAIHSNAIQYIECFLIVEYFLELVALNKNIARGKFLLAPKQSQIPLFLLSNYQPNDWHLLWKNYEYLLMSTQFIDQLKLVHGTIQSNDQIERDRVPVDCCSMRSTSIDNFCQNYLSIQFVRIGEHIVSYCNDTYHAINW